jgi:hypothetical protein
MSGGFCVTSSVCMTVRNCTRDGRPFEGNQVLISSHRKLLSSKAMVVDCSATIWMRERGNQDEDW